MKSVAGSLQSCHQDVINTRVDKTDHGIVIDLIVFLQAWPQNRDYNRGLTQVYNVAPLLHCACCSTCAYDLFARKIEAEIVTRL